ncbi:uncharacterized protein LOC134676848 [Cydia fagiglandana]|uniref:uncharacterized protein LOC134676848 n=1 Tax=Cydia fagiglandana TaxID=1458189 RepID=UPI002FEE42DB
MASHVLEALAGSPAMPDGSKAVRKSNYLNRWPHPSWNYTRHCVELQAITKNGVDVESTRLIHRVIREGKKLDEYTYIKDIVIASAMLISCLFFLLTLAAYGVLPQKRNLPALMLMALVSCLLATFLFRAVQVLTGNLRLKKNVCTFVGLVLYYSVWASFAWMNVMSYDMWTTTCNVYSQHWQPRSKILTKFYWYSTYGFGVPLLMVAFMVGIDYADLTAVPDFAQPHFVNSPYCYFETHYADLTAVPDFAQTHFVNSPYCYFETLPLLMVAFMVGIDYADLTAVPDFAQTHFVNSPYCYFETPLTATLRHVSFCFGVPLLMVAFMVGIDYADLTAAPDFAQPHFVNSPYCYFETQNERRLYVNGPILVTTIVNICFFGVTARYICRNSAKPGGSGDSRNTKKAQNRFIIYLKLTVITGISWLLDVIGAFIEPKHWGWLAVDILNCLSGCYIFCAFICKKEMIVLLCKR